MRTLGELAAEIVRKASLHETGYAICASGDSVLRMTWKVGSFGDRRDEAEGVLKRESYDGQMLDICCNPLLKFFRRITDNCNFVFFGFRLVITGRGCERGA